MQCGNGFFPLFHEFIKCITGLFCRCCYEFDAHPGKGLADSRIHPHSRRLPPSDNQHIRPFLQDTADIFQLQEMSFLPPPTILNTVGINDQVILVRPPINGYRTERIFLNSRQYQLPFREPARRTLCLNNPPYTETQFLLGDRHHFPPSTRLGP
jgi:hypothetical protein